MAGEFGAVIDGEGLAQGRRQCADTAPDMARDDSCLAGFQFAQRDMAGLLLQGDQYGLAVAREQQGVGLVMSGAGDLGTLRDRDPSLDMQRR